MDWQRIAYFIIGLLVGAIFHEYMHGRFADMRGDHTARNAGRLTLNPIPHIDPFGTVLMPLLLIIATGGRFAFAYAKPVPVNPFFLKNPRRDMMMIALAGPLTNFALAAAIAVAAMSIRLAAGLEFGRTGGRLVTIGGSTVSADLFMLLASVAVINVVLGFFNLLPVPPLDGAHVLEYFLPEGARRSYQSIAPYGFIIVIAFLYIMGGAFFRAMRPFFNLIQIVALGSNFRLF